MSTAPSLPSLNPTPPFRTAIRVGPMRTSTGARTWAPEATAIHSHPRSILTRTGWSGAGPSGGRKKAWERAARRTAWPPPVRSVARTPGGVLTPSPSPISARSSAGFQAVSPFLNISALPVSVTTIAGSSSGWAGRGRVVAARAAAPARAATPQTRTVILAPFLSPRPAGRALLEERGNAFLGVVRQRDQGEELPEIAEGCAVLHARHGGCRLLRQAESRGREARERPRQPVHGLVELGPRAEPADEPHLGRLARADLLAREDHEHAPLPPNGPQDGRHHDQRQEPDPDLRQAEDGILGGDDDIAAGRQAAATRKREAVDLGDYRRLHARHGLENSRQAAERVPGLEGRAPIAHALEVRAGAERPVPCPGEHDDTGLRVVLEGCQSLLELA